MAQPPSLVIIIIIIERELEGKLVREVSSLVVKGRGINRKSEGCDQLASHLVLWERLRTLEFLQECDSSCIARILGTLPEFPIQYDIRSSILLSS